MTERCAGAKEISRMAKLLIAPRSFPMATGSQSGAQSFKGPGVGRECTVHASEHLDASSAANKVFV
jgi:hypothetical protein